MPSDFPFLFFLSVALSSTLLVAGVHYYLRTRQDALRWRIEELQEQSGSGGAVPSLRGDIWDSLLRSTYGTVFGKDWFRQKELELMRAGFRGPRVVKVYGIISLVFTAVMIVAAFFGLQDQDLSIRALGLAGALVLGYFVPDQVLVSLRKRHRLNLMAARPDTTDMLGSGLGPGLSWAQPMAGGGQEIRLVYPDLPDGSTGIALDAQ